MRKLIDALESRVFLSATPSTTFVAAPSMTFHPPSGGSTGYVFTTGSLQQTLISGLKVTHTGTLEIDGTSKADSIAITVRNGKIVSGGPFYSVFKLATGGSTTVSTTFVTPGLPTTPIKRIIVNGLGGDDKITVDADVPVAVNGAKGNDMISVFAPSRKIDGGSGTDTITSEDPIV